MSVITALISYPAESLKREATTSYNFKCRISPPEIRSTHLRIKHNIIFKDRGDAANINKLRHEAANTAWEKM
jgi:hypothetical protein